MEVEDSGEEIGDGVRVVVGPKMPLVDPNKQSVKFEINVLNKAEGSAILSMGKNVVLAAYYGPYELKHAKIQDDLAFQVNFKTKAWSHGFGFKTTEELIKSACESMFYSKPFARHESTLVVQEFQDDRSILCASVNAACLAMMTSGLDLQHTVTAGSCCLDPNGEFTVNPDGEKISKSKFFMTAAFECIRFNMVMVHCEGKCSSKDFRLALEVCKSGAEEMLKLFKQGVKKYAGCL